MLILLIPSLAEAASSCAFTSALGMNFGVYADSAASATDATTSVVITCTRDNGPTPTATLQIGPSAGSGLVTTRSLRSGGNILNYNLYRDSGRTQVWGQTSGVDTSSVNFFINNNSSGSATMVVYGRIPALQNVPAGTYSDSVQITISP
jgi:spore coat protein U-like protein